MNRWRININRYPGALDAYNRFKKALGLPPWAPPSDSQRIAFDTVFDSPYFDFEKFLELAANGNKLADCMMGSRKEMTDGR